MAFDDLIEKSLPGGTGLALECFNYYMADGSDRQIEINYDNKTVLVNGDSSMDQNWIVGRFKEIYNTHQNAGNPSPFKSVGKIAVLHKEWSVGIDYGNNNIHMIGSNNKKP